MAGLSGTELAARIGITQARVSRIETAVYRPAPDVVRSWLVATKAPDDVRDELLELAGAAQIEARSWRAIFRGPMVGRQQALAAQDAVARRVRHFQPFMVPGLLQSQAYATAALQAVSPGPEDDGVQAAVEARLARGERLRSSGPEYEILVTEGALLWRPLGVDIDDVRDQLRRVLDAIESSRLAVRVLPAKVPMAQAPMSAFVIVEHDDGSPTTVDVELPGVELRFAGRDELAAWEVAWERMSAAAVDDVESAKIVRRLIAEA